MKSRHCLELPLGRGNVEARRRLEELDHQSLVTLRQSPALRRGNHEGRRVIALAKARNRQVRRRVAMREFGEEIGRGCLGAYGDDTGHRNPSAHREDQVACEVTVCGAC